MVHVAPASFVVRSSGSLISFLAAGSPDAGSKRPPPAAHDVELTHETEVAIATPDGKIDGIQVWPAS
jgi:hypothetical protein